MRRVSLLILLALAACARTSAPPPLPPKPVVAAPPPKPAWVARKVVADAVEGPGGRVHTVKAGETGIAIARAYGVEWQRIVALNKLRAPYVIEVGDRLILPSKKVVAAMTLEQRAAAFRIDIEDLITGAEPAAPVTVKAAKATPPAQKPLPALAGPAPRFDWPMPGRVVSGFGPKPGGRFNDGVNLDAKPGEPVRAAADGVVAYAGDAVAGFGNLVLVKHADGWVSAYAHNSALLVTRGRKVTRGETIAKAGATGAVTSPQLHFELRRGRTAVDPLKVLPQRG
ncbi:M23 family metallopeptidase [Glacieibacterium frigidum]|uniref:M23 family metallopeptidase n=1 Tax=Glacieibacterium frigidum TaxID=2593303 RepID=A0A552UIV1_9SPHN|nr:M23 family metallopeptidase [Glacieibacterium frigidum]TRW18156.1 M23 family metallopeptidase [Glacieibacterium frigidum]